MPDGPNDPNPNKAPFERTGGRITDQHLIRIIEKTREIEAKVSKVPALQRLLTQVLLCLELVRDYRSGEYQQIAPWAMAAVAFALLYFINPLELIPDVIPVVGYLDDVAILALILKLVRKELQQYAAWKKARAQPALSERGPLPHG
jgi:uncharacterized membrane protein YkvA (DUF1232 family)